MPTYREQSSRSLDGKTPSRQRRARGRNAGRANRKFGEVLIDTIGEALQDKGFRCVDSKRIATTVGQTSKQGRPVIPHERIFNLGLKKGQNRSNVFIFTQLSYNKEFVRVLMANPACDQASYNFSQDQLYFRKEIRCGDPDKIAREIADKATDLASKKARNERRMQVHIHSRFDFSGEKLFDDGVSGLGDIVRRAALHNTDVLVFTPHNSIDPQAFATLEHVCSLFGITAVMGLELTMPLTKKHVNGPHHLLMVGNEDAAEEVWRKLLLVKDGKLNMPSYFRSKNGNLLLDNIYKILEPLRKAGVVALGAAHPFNYNSNSLPIKSVGLLSAVDTGQISLMDARARAKELDFIEAWNRSLSPDVMTFENNELFNWISGLVHNFVYTNDSIVGAAQMRNKFSLGEIMSSNVANIALAMWLEKYHGVGQTFGSDDHRTNPLTWRYLVGGDYFGAGFSFFMSDNKPTAEEIVKMVAMRTLGLSSQIYAGTTSNGIQIVNDRATYSNALSGIARDLKIKQTMLYAKVLGYDFNRFLGEDPEMILHMTD